jgi:hypothetical protein
MQATLRDYGAWHFGANIPANPMFTATDADGSTISFTLPSVAQNLNQNTGQQFQLCQ